MCFGAKLKSLKVKDIQLRTIESHLFLCLSLLKVSPQMSFRYRSQSEEHPAAPDKALHNLTVPAPKDCACLSLYSQLQKILKATAAVS